MKQYTIIDEYGYEKDYSYLNKLIDSAIERLKIKGFFTITFIDDDTMHEINFKYRNVDRTTDVISFALNDTEENFKPEIELLGDIFISIPKMIAQAKEYDHSEKRELSFLCIHGLLHLNGYDHQIKEDEQIMFNLQKEVLKNAGITE